MTQRVVTGYDRDGKPAVLFEGDPPLVDRTDKYVTTELWLTDTSPAPLDVGVDRSLEGYVLEPPPTGSRFRLVEILPDEFLPDGFLPDEPAAAGGEEAGGVSGEHRTDTLDYVVVLAGEVTLVVGDREVTLRRGDTVVQQGVEHDWQNRTDQPCLLAAVLLGAVPPDR